ncbi:hypothetical protein TNCV_1284281 [Trichonephila clavipes]|uniref:Uncharacterized protein n=1 Tax=Trichonephila clavipes TaxID=2585209 RepID=A0A8X6SZS3_TRICX|nr:hypothetical protein TNCV_1284281 [Trichonephila clavipes]
MVTVTSFVTRNVLESYLGFTCLSRRKIVLQSLKRLAPEPLNGLNCRARAASDAGRQTWENSGHFLDIFCCERSFYNPGLVKDLDPLSHCDAVQTVYLVKKDCVRIHCAVFFVLRQLTIATCDDSFFASESVFYNVPSTTHSSSFK